MSPSTVVSIVGNPRPASRTHRLARVLAGELSAALLGSELVEVDLARFGPHVLAPHEADVERAVDLVLDADVLVVASPTYKATYSGLLKAFLDRLATGALRGTPAVPLLLGGAPNHSLAVNVHFTPLLLEIGAGVPAGGLFVLESEVEAFDVRAAEWVAQHGPSMFGALTARQS